MVWSAETHGERNIKAHELLRLTNLVIKACLRGNLRYVVVLKTWTWQTALLSTQTHFRHISFLDFFGGFIRTLTGRRQTIENRLQLPEDSRL